MNAGVRQAFCLIEVVEGIHREAQSFAQMVTAR